MKKSLLLPLLFLTIFVSGCRFIVEPDMYVGTYTGKGYAGSYVSDTLSTTLSIVEAGNSKVDIHYSSTNGTQYNFYGYGVTRTGSLLEGIEFIPPSTGSLYANYYCGIYRKVTGTSVTLTFDDNAGVRIYFTGGRY